MVDIPIKIISAICEKILIELFKKSMNTKPPNIANNKFINYDLISLGFWPGGDRDGNPYVTNEITIKTAFKLRSDIIKVGQDLIIYPKN